ncbi:MAG: hypothetical protein WA618_06710 [Terriglobales bacterium]
MSVWFVIPSARPPEEAEKCLAKWLAQGYKVAIQRDIDAQTSPAGWMRGSGGYPDWEGIYAAATFPVEFRPYSGYAESVNFLVKQIMEYDSSAMWFVTGGDDTDPDPNHTADEIAQECLDHFQKGTFGVMQPTGDRYAFDRALGSCAIDRVAGSPWMGREWCARINQGRGPLWSEYTHMFVDEELQAVAIKYGVFWQRPDLIHLHHHYMRQSDALDSKAIHRDAPAHLVEVNSTDHWQKYKKIFEARKAAGFPGSEPL